MGWILSSKNQLLFLSSIGVCRTIMEFYTFSMSDTLDQLWQKQFSESLNPYQNLIKSVISGILLVRGLTGHLYIASYFLILYPILMGKLRSVLLIWMFLSAVRSIILNVGVIILGFIFCSTIENLTKFCFDFAARKAFDLGCSVYMWTVVNNYYHSMKRLTYGRSHIQSPLSSPVSSDQFVDDTSSSILSEEWSLPASLVEELHKNTRENLQEGSSNVAQTQADNLISRSVDSLLAQAMVDWFMKKVFKFKPKVESIVEKSSSLSAVKPGEVTALKVKIKRSIADIKDEEIADLLKSEDEDKLNQFDTKDYIKVISKKKQTDPNSLSKNVTSMQEEFVKKNIKAETSVDTFSGQSVSETTPELSDDTQKLLGDGSIMNYRVATEVCENPFDKIKFNGNPIDRYGPSKALSLVKNLFNENIEESLQNTIERSLRTIKSNDKSSNRFLKDIDFLDDIISSRRQDTKNSSKVNDKALENSYSVVKSLLNDVIVSTVVNSKKGILKKNINSDNQETCASIKCESCKILNFSKESKIDSKGFKNRGMNKKLTFQDEGISKKNKTYDVNLSKYPHIVKNALKDMNIDDVNKITVGNNLRKCGNKENNFEHKQEILRKEFEKNMNKSAAQVKSLRYYYRRINPIKVPIRKNKDTSIRQKSLMSILENIKMDDIKNLSQMSNKPDQNVNDFSGKSIKDFKKINITKHSSAQTITTKRLLEKIKEMEES